MTIPLAFRHSPRVFGPAASENAPYWLAGAMLLLAVYLFALCVAPFRITRRIRRAGGKILPRGTLGRASPRAASMCWWARYRAPDGEIRMSLWSTTAVTCTRYSEVVEAFARACRTCGYSLAGNTSGVCPECGTAMPRVSRRFWHTCSDRRGQILCIVRAVTADWCQLDPASLPHSATIRSVSFSQMEGGEGGKLVDMLEARFGITIADDWWETHISVRPDRELALDTFFETVSLYIEARLISCVQCGRNLNGTKTGVCPKCGGSI